MIEDINDIEIEKLKPCLICGKRTTGEVCSTEHQQEWVKRKQKPKYKPLLQETMESPTTTNQQIKNWNKNPDTKRHGVIAIRKRTYWTIIGFTIFLCILLIWSNLIYSGKNYGTTIDVNNSIKVTPAQTNISNIYKNNHTINVYLDYEEISKMIADEVIDIINNETE